MKNIFAHKKYPASICYLLTHQYHFHALISHQPSKKDHQLTSDDTHWTKWISIIFKFVTRAIESKKEDKNHNDLYAYQYFDHIGAGGDFCPSQSGQMEDQPGIRISLSYVPQQMWLFFTIFQWFCGNTFTCMWKNFELTTLWMRPLRTRWPIVPYRDIPLGAWKIDLQLREGRHRSSSSWHILNVYHVHGNRIESPLFVSFERSQFPRLSPFFNYLV